MPTELLPPMNDKSPCALMPWSMTLGLAALQGVLRYPSDGKVWSNYVSCAWTFVSLPTSVY